MDFLDKASRTRTWSPPAPDRLTCRLVRAMATARVARKESEGPSRVQGLETESRLAAKETAAAIAAQQVTRALSKPQQVDSGPATTPVEITFKPNPVYTEEARRLKLQGEVLLEVMFSANGQLHVNRVVRGMGHGLDEAAVNAANQMRFKPALRNGVPADSTAVVHVVFQLAI